MFVLPVRPRALHLNRLMMKTGNEPETKRNVSLGRVIKVTIASVAFAYCAYQLVFAFEWRAMPGLLATLSPAWFFLGGLISIAAYMVVRTLRWHYLLAKMGLSLRFRDLYFCVVVTVGLAIITPFQSGELLKIEWMKKYLGTDRFTGYGAFTLERMMDLYVVCSIAIWSWLDPTARVVWVLLTLAGLAALMGLSGPMRRRLLEWLSRGRFPWLAEKLEPVLGLERFLPVVLCYTIIGWLLAACGWYSTLRALAIDPGFFEVFTMMTRVTLISILSFVPGAVGVAELSIAEYLQLFDVTEVRAQAAALLMRAYGFLILAMTAVHYVLWRFKRDARETRALP